MGWLKKENILVDYEIYKSIRIENVKEYVFKIEKKWAG